MQQTYIDVMDYITISTLGDATDFGNLTGNRGGVESCGSNTRAFGAAASNGHGGL